MVISGLPRLIPNSGYFTRSGGDTSEQGADSADPHARFIADESGRIMVCTTHNTDISDSWERDSLIGCDPLLVGAIPILVGAC